MARTYQKTCPECGEVFTTDRSIKIYCSKKCMNRAYAKAHPERLQAACRKYREKNVESRLAWQREYQRAHYVHKKTGDHGPTVCPECGSTFTPAHGNQVYCSDACWVRTRNRMQRERMASARKTHEYVKVCKCCGVEFKTSKSFKVYCSPKCCKKSNDHAYHASHAGSRRKAKTNPSGLTDVQMRTVEHDMGLPPDQRRMRSAKWTDAMHRYARKIYMDNHDLFRRSERQVFN